VCCEKNIVEEKTTGLNRRGREIVLDRQNIKIEHFHLEKLKQIECLSTSDLGSESDSGVGSVRTDRTQTQNSTQSKPEVAPLVVKSTQEVPKSPEPQFIDRDSTICTVTRADSMATLDQDCNSLDAFDDDDILSIFTNQVGNESLSDLMMAEFSKMATINVKKLAQDFAKHDERFGNYPIEKQIGRVRPIRSQSAIFMSASLMLKNAKMTRSETLAESTPDVPSTPEIDLKNREKKMRKKRRMTRKTNFDADETETDSTSDSSRDSPCNGRKTFQKKQ
jgi:hypothetical protein